MPGRRLTPEERAVHGPAEDRAKRPDEDRAGGKRVGRRRKRGKPRDPDAGGMSAADEARLRAYRDTK